MVDESISFSCPACGIKLTVPRTLAGVVGPCPSCGNPIQAPTAPVPPPPAIMPEQFPAPVQGRSDEFVPPVLPAALRPEPRQLPSRASHAEPVARQMPEPTTVEASSKPNPLPRHPQSKGPFRRFILGILFLVLSGALIYGVLTVLKNQEQMPAEKNLKPSSEKVSPILPENEPPPKPPAEPEPEPKETPALPEPKETAALPVPMPELPSIAPPPVDVPEGFEPIMPAITALEVLEKFLAASSLVERLAMIETKTPEAELASSVLGGPLPARRSILIDAQEANEVEGVIDIYFNVDFESPDGQLNPQTVLMRKRGSAEPKVVVDPFLDTFGGRLLAYVVKPTDKGGVFQVIISALAACNNENVPDREKKRTLKLLARDNTREIAQAYTGIQSKIGLMLEDGTFSLSYGKAKACTVLLRWNVEDNPEKPYLEALDVKRFDWNP